MSKYIQDHCQFSRGSIFQTIRNADRIAVIEKGRITEVGSHAELIAKPGGHYQKLSALQDLSADQSSEDNKEDEEPVGKIKEEVEQKEEGEEVEKAEETLEISKKKEKELAKKASIFGKEDIVFFLVGGVGALLAGIMVRIPLLSLWRCVITARLTP